MATELRKQGIEMTRHRAARLMRKYVIRAKSHRRFVKTTDSTHADPIAANLLGRDFRAGEGSKTWCADITYLRTSTGPIYLAAVLDIRTRKWVGYSVAKHMDTSLVNSALDMALLQESKMPEMMHTDRGSQYASASHRARLQKNGITLSMSGKGECWDNAAMESFFGTFKTEVGNVFIDEDDARASIFDFQAFYNHERLHSALNNQSPIVFERQLKKQLLN
ncbi:UNVERIFIED_CONTAM: hypothetical protein GTU68_056060 [Idotea baltica]|nr:hypothetical protein [Idotea baltica]